MRESLFIIILLIVPFCVTPCTRERCCSLTTCSSAYCLQKNTETWISDLDYTDYQYTKLTLGNNDCLPCPYNCKSCSSTSSCDVCLTGYYQDANNECQLCGYKCSICSIVNDISKCSECQQGTYLDGTTLTCKSCPSGAKSCANANTII